MKHVCPSVTTQGSLKKKPKVAYSHDAFTRDETRETRERVLTEIQQSQNQAGQENIACKINIMEWTMNLMT